jgi:hypothetical protein
MDNITVGRYANPQSAGYTWSPGGSPVLPPLPDDAYPPGAVPLEPSQERTGGDVTASESVMHQEAPYPHTLAALVDRLAYRTDRGWRVWLADIERDAPRDGQPGSRGLTLVVQRAGPDSYEPQNMLRVNHYFPVPPATYDERSWRRWLFDRLGDVDTHERCEDFILVHRAEGGYIKADGSHADELHERPYAPSHGPGNDPYLVREIGTTTDRRTSFRGLLDDDGTGHTRTG